MSVAYIRIGSQWTDITIQYGAGRDTSTNYCIPTPREVRRAKYQIYRDASQTDSAGAVLDQYLLSVWDSFHLQTVHDVVMLTHFTEPKCFVCHVLRWFTACQHRVSSGTVSALEFSLFTAAMHGVGSECVVVDFGSTYTRVMPVLHRAEVTSLAISTKGISSSFSKEDFTRLLEHYLFLLILCDEAESGEDATPVAPVMIDTWAGEAASSCAADLCEAVEQYACGMEEAILNFIARARSTGMGCVLRTWILAGGGAASSSVRNYCGYILSKYVPQSIVIWT